jgi:PPK2 family polyphosphate:nucleotide phosphotransferase
MKTKELIKRAGKLAKPFRVVDGEKFHLKDIDPGDTLEFDSEDKPRSKEILATGIDALAELQDMLYAQNRWAMLLIFQAMDAAGKDGTIKHVMSGVNPQGCQVFSFKSPSAQDLNHDYLWRCMTSLPERGRIGIFNRSYYEETLVVRAHPELLEGQRLPPDLVTTDIWKDRYKDIRNFERYLTRNGIVIRKFFLHVSRKEQSALSRATPESGEELEVLGQRHQRARALGRLHAGLRGDDPRHRDQARAVVRRARRQQVVHTSCRRGRHHQDTGLVGAQISQGQPGEAPGARRGEEGIAGREIANGPA